MPIVMAVASWHVAALIAAPVDGELVVRVDPLTRYVFVTYPVSADAPEEVEVRCAFSPRGRAEWKPAAVTPFLSATALRLARVEDWNRWMREGLLTECRAAGLKRTVVFHPYPDAERDGRVDVDFRIQLATTSKRMLATLQTRVQVDNTDVVLVEDWSQVYQREAVVLNAEPAGRQWIYRTKVRSSDPVSRGDALYCPSHGDVPLPQLTYPLDLRGAYAIFVCTSPGSQVTLRLTGDESSHLARSLRYQDEMLFAWRTMDREDLIIGQSHSNGGFAHGQIDYVRLVPLSPSLVKELEAEWSGPRDKQVAAYYEPYSWAFNEVAEHNWQHFAPLSLYAAAGVDIVDAQFGRFGMKPVYETRLVDRLLYNTTGDPYGDGTIPKSLGVGRMQQYTASMRSILRYSRFLGLSPSANFGASACYLGSPIQEEVSKKHPEYLREESLRFELPEVRKYALDLYREMLQLGADSLSLDFCRYPETIDKAETATLFLRELRALTKEHGNARIIVRFPGTGVRAWEKFDYRAWIKEELIDILVPSNIINRHMHIDMQPYVQAVRGSSVKLLPNVEGNCAGIEMPGLFLWRVKQVYDAGVDGIYIYQADARLLGRFTDDARTMKVLGSSEAVNRFWQRDAEERPQRSKGVYPTPSQYQNDVYWYWERLHVLAGRYADGRGGVPC